MVGMSSHCINYIRNLYPEVALLVHDLPPIHDLPSDIILFI
jgi:hypothetical protein